MRDVDAAWAAGIIDGEGCIFIKKTPPSQVRGAINPSHSLGVKVVMNHEATIARLFHLFEIGHYYPLKQRHSNTSYQWIAAGSQCAIILTTIQPYCITKSEEILVGLDFLARARWYGGHHRGPMPPDPVAERDRLWQRMRDLKPRSAITSANRAARQKQQVERASLAGYADQWERENADDDDDQ